MTISASRSNLALAIAGFDPSGGAGVLADARTFEALGVYPFAVVTSITFQSTAGVEGRRDVEPRDVASQVETLARDREPHAVKTGMLPTRETVLEVARLATRWKLGPLVVDPVMRAGGGEPLMDEGGTEAIVEELLPRARLVTPNAAELAELCGFDVFDVDDVKAAALWLSKRAGCSVLVTGLRSEVGSKTAAADVFLDEAEFEVFEGPWVEGLDVHGTGCVLSAAVTAHLALGRTLPEAVRRGREFTSAAIGAAVTPGSGREVAYPSTGSPRAKRRERR